MEEHDWLALDALNDAITAALERLHNRPRRADKGGLQLALNALEGWLESNHKASKDPDWQRAREDPEPLPVGPFESPALRTILVHVALDCELTEITEAEHHMFQDRLSGRRSENSGCRVIVRI